MTFFFATLAALFSVVNPLGAVPVYLALTPDYTPAERRKTALNTGLWFTAILLVFFFIGQYILGFFGIDVNALRIAGGIVIFTSGLALLNGKFAESRAVNNKVRKEALEKEDVSFAPMAMPMLSGPGSISLLLSMYIQNPSWDARTLIALSVIVLGGLVFGILLLAPKLFKLLGHAGLKAVSRIMGFIVMAIGVQYVIKGVVDLVLELAKAS